MNLNRKKFDNTKSIRTIDRAQAKKFRFIEENRFMILVFATLSIELLVLSLAQTLFGFVFVCRSFAPSALCELLSSSVGRATVFIAVCLLLAVARLDVFKALLKNGGEDNRRLHWFYVNLVGFTLVLSPWFFLGKDPSSSALICAFVLWTVGGFLGAVGAVFSVAPLRQWKLAASQLNPWVFVLLIAAVFTPEITSFARSVWTIEPLTKLTFQMVVLALSILGIPATATPEKFILSHEDFSISISEQCSGVEGFALITFFLVCYVLVFRKQLRFPHSLLLFPVGIFLSWLLNVLRISVLFAIGIWVSPELAVNGFHSHAGWLMFALLSLTFIGASRKMRWFQPGDVKPAPSLRMRDDWLAARIVPFAGLMGASLILSTFTQLPDLWYPLKALAMAMLLAPFWAIYLRLNWRIDHVAVWLGLLIGVAWIIVSWEQSDLNSPLQVALDQASGLFLMTWIVFRLIGTVFFIPVIEEIFFRGYVLARLDQGGSAHRIVALTISTALFAALHDKWELAAIAGLIYGLLYLRNKNLTDCIVSHCVSNLTIGFVALISGNWSII